jgi:hypothetical protein
MVRLKPSVSRRNQAGFCDEPSMSSTTEGRFPMGLRVSLDDEDWFVEKQCVVATNEGLFQARRALLPSTP